MSTFRPPKVCFWVGFLGLKFQNPTGGIALQNFDASSLECWCALALFGAPVVKKGVLLVKKEALEHSGTQRFVLYRICDVSHPLKVHLVLFNELCGKSRNLWISVINFRLLTGPKLILPVDSGGLHPRPCV